MSEGQQEQRREDPGFSLLRSIRGIVHQVALHSRRLYRDAGLTVPQLLVLRAIHESESEPISLALVADQVHLSRSTVSNIVERLVQGGLVSRERGPRDRRSLRLGLTERGVERLEALPSPLQDHFLERFAALEPARQAVLLGALEEVVGMMGAEDMDAAPMRVSGEQIRNQPPER